MPGPELPYVVAIVEIVEQPSVRLTTNLVNCPHDDDRDRHAGAGDVRAPRRSRRRRLHPAVRARRGDESANEMHRARACISGVGQSDIGRRLGRDPLELTLDACLAAIEDAGLTRDDIDGLSTYPGPMATPPGFSGAGAYDVIDALRLNVRLVRQRARDVGPARVGDQGVHRGRRRAVRPRACASARCGRAPRRGTRAAA